MDSETSLIIFQGKNIRRTWQNEEWFLSIIDVVMVLTNSSIPRRYWSDLKNKLREEGFELYDKIVQLKLQSTDGKFYETDCANTETLLRIVQSIPSPKAEPFKRWLARVGYERIQEIENPELAQKRMRELYEKKGYSNEWIERRVRGIAVRDELTNEWDKRAIKKEKEYAILTAEISKATFGLTPSEYKELKRLKRENLRDHMTDLELIFSMLGEAATTEITKNKNAQGFDEGKEAAQEGGAVAGGARRDLETRSGRRVVTSENYLEQQEAITKLERKKTKRLYH